MFSILNDIQSVVPKAHSSKSMIKSTDAQLHALSVCGELQVSAYCNDWHSCCGAAELGPCVKVLLDLPSHRQLVLILWHTIILGNTKKASAPLPAAYSFSILYVHRQFWWKGRLQNAELTLTHGWPSTCTAVYLWSTSTCSIPVIRA